MSNYHSLVGDMFGIDRDQGPMFRGQLVGGRVLPRGEGRDFFVSSVTGASGSTGRSPKEALSTLDAAFAKTTANRGDRIIVMENHAETITGAGGITHDVAGVSVIGLGVGDQRPRFLMDAGTSVSYLISAADAYVENLVFAAGHADIVTCFDVTAKNANIVRCEFVENVATENFLTPIKATGADNTADGLTIIECNNFTVDSAAVEFLEVTGNLIGLTMLRNKHYAVGGTASPLILSAGAKNLTMVDIGYNLVQIANTANDLLIDNGGAANSGIIHHNLVGNLDVTGAQVLGAATGIQFFGNEATSTSTESGAVAPAADTPNS